MLASIVVQVATTPHLTNTTIPANLSKDFIAISMVWCIGGKEEHISRKLSHETITSPPKYLSLPELVLN